MGAGFCCYLLCVFLMMLNSESHVEGAEKIVQRLQELDEVVNVTSNAPPKE